MTTAASLAQSVAPGVSLGFKNRIINGDMRVAQYSTASVTPSNGYNTVDRWGYWSSQASKFTQQQNLNSVTPPVGFTKYLGNSVASSVSIGSGDYFFLQQGIEGLNLADMAWGTNNAKTVTLSFWVYSSLTGTFGGSLQNGGQTRSYPFTYTISSASTWEQKTITIAGDTTGTWATDYTAGAYLNFGLGCGSTYSGTASAWATANYFSATGATSVVGTNGATFYITGVQLESGSAATNFDFRDITRELAMCQRYYYCHVNGYGKEISLGSYYSSTQVEGYIAFPVTMRTSPTGVNTTGANYYICYRNGGYDVFNSITIPTETSTTCAKWFNASEASGTAGQVGNVVTNDGAGYLGFKAEL